MTVQQMARAFLSGRMQTLPTERRLPILSPLSSFIFKNYFKDLTCPKSIKLSDYTNWMTVIKRHFVFPVDLPLLVLIEVDGDIQLFFFLLSPSKLYHNSYLSQQCVFSWWVPCHQYSLCSKIVYYAKLPCLYDFLFQLELIMNICYLFVYFSKVPTSFLPSKCANNILNNEMIRGPDRAPLFQLPLFQYHDRWLSP